MAPRLPASTCNQTRLAPEPAAADNSECSTRRARPWRRWPGSVRMANTPAQSPSTAQAPIATGPPVASKRANTRIASDGGEDLLETGVDPVAQAYCGVRLGPGWADHHHRLGAWPIARPAKMSDQACRRAGALDDLEQTGQVPSVIPRLGGGHGFGQGNARVVQRPAGVDPSRKPGGRMQSPSADLRFPGRRPGPGGNPLQGDNLFGREFHFSASSESTSARASAPDQSAPPVSRARSTPLRSKMMVVGMPSTAGLNA